jgi:hypothetical protein
VLFEKHLQLEERLDAVFRGSAAPLRIGSGRGFDGTGDLGGIGDGYASENLGSGGIDDVVPLGSLGFDPLSVDELWDLNGGRCCYGHLKMPFAVAKSPS